MKLTATTKTDKTSRIRHMNSRRMLPVSQRQNEKNKEKKRENRPTIKNLKKAKNTTVDGLHVKW